MYNENNNIVEGLVIGGLYKHFKGNLYKVIDIATSSNDLNKKVVIYKSLYGDKKCYVRDLDEWGEIISNENGFNVKRFTFVDKLKIKASIDMKKRTINNRTFSETAIQKFSDQVNTYLIPIIEPSEYDNGTYDNYIPPYYDYKSVIGGFNKGSIINSNILELEGYISIINAIKYIDIEDIINENFIVTQIYLTDISNIYRSPNGSVVDDITKFSGCFINKIGTYSMPKLPECGGIIKVELI